MKTLIKQHPVIAILRGVEDHDLMDYMNSLYQGGLRSFEVSFSNGDAPAQIKKLKELMPADTFIGAGTVLTVADVEKAEAAGADFMLSPSANPSVLSYCGGHGLKFLPGVLTPTDVSVCLEYGFHTLKLFPASCQPRDYIKTLRGPFPDTDYVAVGGISPSNAADYLKSGFTGVGIGSALTDPEAFRQKDWSGITLSIQKFLKDLREENLL